MSHRGGFRAAIARAESAEASYDELKREIRSALIPVDAAIAAHQGSDVHTITVVVGTAMADALDEIRGLVDGHGSAAP